MIRILILSIGLLGFHVEDSSPPAEPLCVLCMNHIGTCGCTPLGATVCCDGYIAVGCLCNP